MKIHEDEYTTYWKWYLWASNKFKISEAWSIEWEAGMLNIYNTCTIKMQDKW